MPTNESSSVTKLEDPHIAGSLGPMKLGAATLINPFLGFFIDNWKIMLFIAMAGAIYFEYKIIGHYRLAAAADAVQISTLKTDLKQSNEAINDQNKKIQEFSKDSQDKQKKFDALAQELKDKGAKDQKAIDTLRKKPLGNTCDDALKFMNDYIGDLK